MPDAVQSFMTQLVQAGEKRGVALSRAHRERREAVERRNRRIQEVGPRPADGTTFGSGKVPKRAA